MSNQTAAWVTQEGWAPTCSFRTFEGSVRTMEPPEFCENDVVPDTDYCPLHTEEEPDPDEGSFRECYEADFDHDYFDDDFYLAEWH